MFRSAWGTRWVPLAAAATLSVLGCVGGCATPAPTRESMVAEAAAAAAAVPAEFPAAAGILDGFDLGQGAEGTRAGDRVLLGIRLEKAGAAQVRYLLVELTDHIQLQPRLVYSYSAPGKRGEKRKIESALMQTRLTLFDEKGERIDHATGQFPMELLGYGLYDGAEPMVGAPSLPSGEPDIAGLSDEQFERSVRGWLTLVAFSGSMNKKGMFRPLIEDVIAKPSLLALLLNPSFGLGTIGSEVKHGETWRAGEADVPTVQLPLICTLAGSTCATAQVTAARPLAPLSLCGGVVRLIGRNPADSTVRFEMQLLAARRGPESAPVQPAADSAAP